MILIRYASLIFGSISGKAFSSNNIITNPLAGLMIGVVATVLLQSSSTTTSIIVTMVASDCESLLNLKMYFSKLNV